eukprot:1248668-Alexandrium_andersonii.AAC.1
MGHFPILFGVRTPLDQPHSVQFPTWVTNLPQWSSKVDAKLAAARAEGREGRGAEVNGLHPAFRDLHYLKEAFEEAAQELVHEHKLQHKLRSDEGFQVQYLA